MDTLRLTVEQKVAWLISLKGGPITALLYLWIVGRPIHRALIDRAFGWDKATTRKHLGALELHGLATQVDEVWQLIQAGYQIAFEFRPAEAAPVTGAGELSPAAEDDRENFSRENFSRPIIIINKESNLLTESINNKNNAARNFLGGGGEKNPRPSGHIGKLIDALARKGLPEQTTADPLPPELRACVDALVRLGAPRGKAELAVAESAWDAAIIQREIQHWQTYRQSSAGKGLNAQFPFLVLKRIKDAERCPIDEADPYSGYFSYSKTTDGDESPNDPMTK